MPTVDQASAGQISSPCAQSPLREAVSSAYRLDEREAVQALLIQDASNTHYHDAVGRLARTLVEAVRTKRIGASGVDALMHEFSLSSEEGIALMCLAEALLRIPDHQTADRLIADKISKGDWRKHLGESPSLFVNAATWGLLITGKLVGLHNNHCLASALTKLIKKGGEPLIRQGVDLAMRMLGNQFVKGQTINEAIANSKGNEARGYRYSYDMLGEAALTESDANKYYASYEQAIHAIGVAANGRGIRFGPGISVKLSALHPRYSRAQRTRVMKELLPRLKKLLLLAKHYNIGLNIDAEEADRTELSLELLEKLAFDPSFDNFEGTGFVVQAYQKRAPFIIDYLTDLALRSGRKLMVRLVKGAYWDTEIKRAQVDGMSGYPVYTRKIYTDVSYLVCAKKLLKASNFLYPQFATHNAHTLASVYIMAQELGITDYEFQCLHGMGESLYDQVLGREHLNQACRIYAPVGSHQTLLAYLVRRLLENGANSSFVNQIVDEHVSIETLLTDPFEAAHLLKCAPHPEIPLPIKLFGNERINSLGLDLSDENVLRSIEGEMNGLESRLWNSMSLLGSGNLSTATDSRLVHNPANHFDRVGCVVEANLEDVESALEIAEKYAIDWQTFPSNIRAEILCRGANLLELHQIELISLAIREAGKTLANAMSEVREAIDFLRYYSSQVNNSQVTLALGPVVCISPWNFPLAIFIGQISAALAAGNVVLAKPAEQTSLIAFRAVQLLHQAGVPQTALQFLPGRGELIGARLCSDSRVRGVIFTGSTEVAKMINRSLVTRIISGHSEIPLIAETGGQNAMIVDSSALPEQVVQDIISSAFDSAGQRCSALRVLYLQEDIADKVINMLRGAMSQLCIGDPRLLATDIGPVIDVVAKNNLNRHIDQLKTKAKNFFQIPLPSGDVPSTFVSPTLAEIGNLSELTDEVFGPVLHVIRYTSNALQTIVEDVNKSGYGLTLGIHSRINETIDFISHNAHVGNIYVNRNIVGAVVGVQPFGGEGKSGTGPKAGGPLYIKRLQRNPLVDFHSLNSTPYLHIKKPFETPHINSLLEEFSLWIHLHGFPKIAGLIDEYVHASLFGLDLELPGPTGEQNTLSFYPRGLVLCAAGNLNVFLNQLSALLATGNIPVVTSETYQYLPDDFPASVRNVIRVFEDIDIDELRLALTDASHATVIRSALAANDGLLISVIETNKEDVIALWRLVTERTFCINTTASGGNNSLMSLQT